MLQPRSFGPPRCRTLWRSRRVNGPRSRHRASARCVSWPRLPQDWREAQRRQDRALDRIGAGVDQLGAMAREFGDTLKTHDALVEDIGAGLDRANASLKSNNKRLEAVLHSVRSSRHLCCDIVLLCMLLGIGGYLVSILADKSG